MKPKISLVTLGVADLDRAKRFYRDGLGFPLEVDAPEVGIFRLDGTWLSVYRREDLATDLGLPAEAAPPAFHGFSLAHNVQSRAAVDAVIELAVAAGGRVLTPPRDMAWGGYAGHFADPEGFPWEVAWNPDIDLT
jgi:catechol 2,3-dioxygenase-like lactoylglutathione lyase family enzyme